jgi:outer membrane protein OmpA-like peptidoglycan-associated protein
MAVDLFELASGFLNPSVVSKIAGIVGESPAATQRAVEVTVPTLAGAACNRASTISGANDLLSLVTSSSVDSDIASKFASHLVGGSTTDSLLRSGGSLVNRLFGGNSASVADLIASASGVSARGATSLLSIIAPLFFGMLSRQVSTQNLTGTGLSNFLSSHRDTIQRLAPSGLANALGVNGMSNLCGAPAPVERPVAYAEKSSGLKWLWLLLPLLALLFLIPWLRSCNTSTMPKLASITLPCGTTLSVEEGSFNYNLATFMMKGSDSELPKRIVFDHLNFDSGTTHLTPESNPTVRDLLAILKCYPNSLVLLEGHTDSTGDPVANKKLSLDRANAIKDLLVQGGVDVARISTDGWGQEKPIASNDTEEGKAKNRRTELIVTKR